jgi:hypothetical protein
MDTIDHALVAVGLNRTGGALPGTVGTRELEVLLQRGQVEVSWSNHDTRIIVGVTSNGVAELAELLTPGMPETAA